MGTQYAKSSGTFVVTGDNSSKLKIWKTLIGFQSLFLTTAESSQRGWFYSMEQTLNHLGLLADMLEAFDQRMRFDFLHVRFCEHTVVGVGLWATARVHSHIRSLCGTEQQARCKCWRSRAFCAWPATHRYGQDSKYLQPCTCRLFK